jgi:PAS domain S-box-containing protein
MPPLESKFVTATGEGIFVELSANLLRDAYGKPVGIVGIAKNINDRKKAEEELRASEEKFRILAEQSPSMIFINQNGKIVYVNPKCEELMGYTKKEYYSPDFDFLSLIAPEHLDLIKLNVQKHRDGEEVTPCEYSLVTKNGNRIETIITTKLVTYNGQPAILGTITDITDRKKAQEALQRERYMVEYITERMGAVLAVISPRFQVLWGNSVLEKMHDVLEGQTCYKLFAKRDSMCPGCGVKEVFETGKNLVIHQQTVPDKNGNPFWLELYATPMRDKAGIIVSVLELVVDINDRKESEKKLDELMNKLLVINEKLGVVGKIARHDARNKLVVIMNNVYLAKKRLDPNHDALEFLDCIESASDQMESIFDFARVYEKVGTEQLSYVDVKASVDEACLLLSCFEGNLLNECSGLKVLADSLLRQVFYNLLDNTQKYGDKFSKVRVYYKKRKDCLQLIYEDNGVGIPEEDKQRIFEEGYGKGSGYGLYLIKKICETYNWAIKETGTFGKGAQFTIVLPKTAKKGKPRYIIE